MSRWAKILVGVVALVSCLAAITIAQEKPVPVPVPSILDQAKNSPLGSRHWNIFRKTVNNPEDPEQSRCIGCHSAVAIVDDPKAQLTDFLKAGQQYCIGEEEVDGKTVFKYDTAKVDGKYVANDFEGITCRVCHVMDNRGIALRRPDNTCTLCHGRAFNWTTGSGHHVEQDFIEGHGDGYWEQSVHYTLGMKCEDCHMMNSVKHDYAPAKPEDIVKDAFCLNCHKSADELEKMIQYTETTVGAAVKSIKERVKAAEAGKLTDAQKALVKKAKDRVAFIEGDLSNGVHNPQFAGRLINEAFEALDQAEGKTVPTPRVNLGNLMVYSQAQSSKLGNAHWDMLESTVFNPEDPDQDRCITCHSAVAIVDDPKAKVADFLPKGAKYCTGEEEVDGKPVFRYAETTQDGKYLKNHLEGITCRVCHTFGKDGNIGLRRSKEQTCGLCHGRSFNWATGSGHHVELAFLKGQGSQEKGIEDKPNMKVLMGFACQDCHFMDSTKHDFQAATPEQIAANPNCKSCHANPADLKKTIEEIQSEVKGGLAKLQPRLDKAKAWVAKNAKNKEAAEVYAQAEANVNFIVSDYSYGVHNPDYARELLARAGKLLDQFEAKYK
ncbi:MAG: ammonia-forming cytochrome c nitrite reductase subunit c552 [Betaproteobacteria bacterium]